MRLAIRFYVACHSCNYKVKLNMGETQEIIQANLGYVRMDRLQKQEVQV